MYLHIKLLSLEVHVEFEGCPRALDKWRISNAKIFIHMTIPKSGHNIGLGEEIMNLAFEILQVQLICFCFQLQVFQVYWI